MAKTDKVEEVKIEQTPVEEAVVAEPSAARTVMFQYDRDTTCEASVLDDLGNDLLDLLVTGVSHQSFSTSATIPAGSREFLKVRRGSSREVGTWFPTAGAKE